MLTLDERFPVVRVVRLHSFLVLWSGQFLSQIGDSIFRLTLAWLVLQTTGSVLSMGVVLVVNVVPSALFSLLGGVFADRFSRRAILLVTDSVRGLVVGLVACLIWFHMIQFWHILVLSFVFGIAESMFFPAYQAIIPQLVEGEALQPANSLLQVGTLVSRVLGPACALFLLATVGAAGAFATDALSFAFSVGSLVFVGVLVRRTIQSASQQQQEDGPSETPTTMLQDIRSGITFVRYVPWLWITIALAALGNVTYFAPMMIALPRLALHLGYWLLGVFSTADALGGIVVALLLMQVHITRRRGLLAYSALFCSFASLVILGLPLPSSQVFLYFLLAGIMSGAGLGVFEVVWNTLLQEKVPGEMLGRVSSVDWLGSNALLPVGLVVIGLLTDHLGSSSVLLLCGGVSLVLAIIGMAIPGVRRL